MNSCLGHIRARRVSTKDNKGHPGKNMFFSEEGSGSSRGRERHSSALLPLLAKVLSRVFPTKFQWKDAFRRNLTTGN